MIQGFGGAEAIAFAAEFAFRGGGAGALLAGTRLGFRQFLAAAGEAGFADGDAGREATGSHLNLDATPFFLPALKKNIKARNTFENFSPSHQRDYLEWINDAKRDQTRRQRLATSIGSLAEGKPRNWKYITESRMRSSSSA